MTLAPGLRRLTFTTHITATIYLADQRHSTILSPAVERGALNAPLICVDGVGRRG